ncbi:MAG TPA: NDP-sugar synthase, partial [Acidimicrobiales bacterium]|nr:NDP-sugar synthase [Acidimicrobiales bacterium]
VRAVVLVGGFGTRLRPLTLTTPKPMLPVAGRPMIERTIRLLAAHGVDEVVLSLGFASSAFTDAFPDDTCAGVRLVYAVEPSPLDTAGAVRFAATAAGISERFIVANSDVMTDLDLSALLAFHETTGAEGTIALTPVDDPSQFGVVPTFEDGRVSAFVEKPAPGTEPTNLINAGFYVLEPSVLGRVEPDVKVSIERVTFPAMVADGALYALADESYWIDVGTPERYLTANLDLLDEPDERGWVAVDAGIAPSAVVRDSVVLDGAVVGDGAVVERSILGPGARVGAGASVTEVCVIGHEAVVPDGARLVGQRLPEPETS